LRSRLHHARAQRLARRGGQGIADLRIGFVVARDQSIVWGIGQGGAVVHRNASS
jgi:hypothetical protein